jgi:hypothetical protein
MEDDMKEYEVSFTVTVTVEATSPDGAEAVGFDLLNELVGEKYLIVHEKTEEN